MTKPINIELRIVAYNKLLSFLNSEEGNADITNILIGSTNELLIEIEPLIIPDLIEAIIQFAEIEKAGAQQELKKMTELNLAI